MRAVYLRSMKSPIGHPQGFVFRPPERRVMNHSDIFSQAVVEQDSDYLQDSFCVDTDEDVQYFDESVAPVSCHSARKLRSARNRAETDPSKKRKRIIENVDESTTDSEVSPMKMSSSVLISSSPISSVSTSPVIPSTASNYSRVG